MRGSNAQVFRDVMDQCFGMGDMTAVDKYFREDFEEHEHVPGDKTGRDGVKEIIRVLRTAFPDLRATIEDLSEDRDKLWARVRFSGTNSGELMGTAATGKRANFEAIDCVRFVDGKLAEHWGVVDMLGLLQQLGIAPVPAASRGGQGAA
jgi:predicted ester cyclase